MSKIVEDGRTYSNQGEANTDGGRIRGKGHMSNIQ